MRIACLPLLLTVFSFSCGNQEKEELPVSKPNIVLIYVDDLGYGDLGCYGATAVQTPNVDRMAKNGTRFTDGHCTAATCTPSRFSLLTGMYAFRNNAAILPGDAPSLIKPGMATLPGMLQEAGYTTGVVGKWHLGLADGNIDWNGTVKPGPNEIGFDYSFLIPATTDRVPTVFLENGKVPNLDPNDSIEVSYTTPFEGEPTGRTHPELLKQGADDQHSDALINGISRIGFMKGGEAARWVDEEIPMVLDEKAKNFITGNKNKPFFLYYSFPNIHVPRAPNKMFAGTSSLGPRGDVINEMDWMTGQIMDYLDSLHLSSNTLIIFTSDNGPVLDDGYHDQAYEKNGDHKPAGVYRGGKYSAFEAGTRVPTITYWPGKIQASVSNAVVSQVDLFASLRELIGGASSGSAAPDSRNMLDAWLGISPEGREVLLEESYSFSIRKGKWKYIAPFNRPVPDWMKNKREETGLMKSPQLYNLEEDPGEKNNLAAKYPDVLKEMEQVLKEELNTGENGI